MKCEVIISLILTIIAIVLLLVSFLAPPLAIIDNSVLGAVGELFGFSAMWQASLAFFSGRDVSIRHGQTEINIKDNDNENENI